MNQSLEQNDAIWIAASKDMLINHFGEVSFAFHRISGDTHMLNFLSRSILDRLIDTPTPAHEIVDKTPEHVGLTWNDCPLPVVLKTFKELSDTGLIKEIPDAINTRTRVRA